MFPLEWLLEPGSLKEREPMENLRLVLIFFKFMSMMQKLMKKH